jgi:hypothetical protein
MLASAENVFKEPTFVHSDEYSQCCKMAVVAKQQILDGS